MSSPSSKSADCCRLRFGQNERLQYFEIEEYIRVQIFIFQILKLIGNLNVLE
jgi:hypothetical protein